MRKCIEAALGLFLCYATGFLLLYRPRWAVFVGIFYLVIGLMATAIYAVLGMWKEEHEHAQAQSGQAILGMGEEGRPL